MKHILMLLNILFFLSTSALAVSYKLCLTKPCMKWEFECSLPFKDIPSIEQQFISHQKAEGTAKTHLFDAYKLSTDDVIVLKDGFIEELRFKISTEELRYKLCGISNCYFKCHLPYDEIPMPETIFVSHDLAVKEAQISFSMDAYVLNDGRIITLEQKTIGQTTPAFLYRK